MSDDEPYKAATVPVLSIEQHREVLLLEKAVHDAAIERNKIALEVNKQTLRDLEARAFEMRHAQAYRDACLARDYAVDARHEREVVALERIADVLTKIAERGYGLVSK